MRILFRISGLLLFCIAVLFFFSCKTVISSETAAQAYIDLGNGYLEQNELTKAIDAFNTALQYDSSLKIARFNLAKVYALREDFRSAMKTVDELLAEDTENILLLELKAWIFYRQEKNDEAFAVYADILNRDPLFESALFNSGIILVKKQDYKAAAGFFRRAQEINADDGALFFMIALCEYELGQYHEAIKFFCLYSAKDDPDESARIEREFQAGLLLGKAYIRIGEYSEAIDLFRALQQDSGMELQHPLFQFWEGVLFYYAVEDIQKGLDIITCAIEAGFDHEAEVREMAMLPDFESSEDLEAVLGKFAKALMPPEKPDGEKTAPDESGADNPEDEGY